MYLHLGSDIVVPEKEIVAVMDMENTTMADDTRNFLRKAGEAGCIIPVSPEDIPRSYILTVKTRTRTGTGTEKGKERLPGYLVYLSPISATTLYKRHLTGGIK